MSTSTLAHSSRTVISAVHSVWREWSNESRTFASERPALQAAFKGALSERLPAGWSVSREVRLNAERRFSAWSLYDIGVKQGSDVMGMVELSLGDTNVPHALHNGELKLLGNCGGVGVSTGRLFSMERGLTSADVGTVQGELAEIPVRGLFFVNPGPRAVLDRQEKAMWWETKPIGFKGETHFWSALMAPDTMVTLRQVFGRLADAGLCCWFYSVCGEEDLECLEAEGFDN